MRGSDERTGSLFSYVDLEARVRKDHPLRAIRRLVNETLALMERDFATLYAGIGRPSIAPEKLLRAMLLQAFYSVRSERQLMERLEFDLLFRWFVGLGVDEPVWDHSTFSKNRDRLLEGAVAARFLATLLAQYQAASEAERPAVFRQVQQLEAENAYTEAMLAPTEALQGALFEEMKGRIKEDDRSVPAREGAFEYGWRFAAGAQYRTWHRRALDGAEAVTILDENELAGGKDYFRLAGLAPSPGGALLAFTTDEDGSERYRVRIKDAASGELLPDLIHVELFDLLDQRLERRLGEGAGLREDDDTVAHCHDRRDRADVELSGEVLLGLGVHLAEGDLGVLLRGPLVGGGETYAGPAPAGPEVDQDDPVLAGHLIEVLCGQRNGRHDLSVHGN